MPPKKGSKRDHPNLGTAEKIRELAIYREEYMRQRGKVPVWTAACYRMGLSLKTVLRHAPELAENWYAPDFHWWESGDHMS